MWSICILSIKQYEKVRLLQCFAMQKNTKITKLKSQLTFTDKKPKLKAFSYPEEKIVPVIGILHGDNKHQKANTKLIEEALKQGFKPKWYCVFHFNDGGSSKRQQFRRTQFDDVGHKIHHTHDLALERPTHAQGGDKGEDAVTSRHGGRFESNKGHHQRQSLV